MKKLLRNTIILTSIWVIILIAGIFFIYGHQKKISTKLKNEESQKSKRLDELRLLNKDLSELQNYYQRLHYISLKYKGTLASFESPGETFDYIRRELSSTHSNVRLSMDFQKEENFKSMMKRQYELRGTGKFIEIYNLLWFLENGPVFYKIEKLSVNKIDETDNANMKTPNEEASFNFMLVGFDRTQGPKITEINRDFGQPVNIANLFNNLTIKKNKKPKNEPKQYAVRTQPKSGVMHLPRKPKNLENPQGLPEVNSNCQVMAITPFSVLFKDAKGKLVKLRKGDKVFGGNLTKLDTQSGKAFFNLSNNSGNKSVVLTLQK